MKKIFIKTATVLSILVQVSFASSAKDSTIDLYGIRAKSEPNRQPHAGAGIKYDSRFIKIKLEGTSVFFKSAAVFNFDPYKNWNMKLGLNYLHQQLFAPDNANARVDQYSSAFSVRYMLLGDLYTELGGSYTKLNGTNIGTDYIIEDEITKVGYVELVKRVEMPIGTMDTSMNYGRVDYGLKDDEDSYGAGIDYYLTDGLKISYKHQHEKNNNINLYSAGYGMFFMDFTDNISNNTNQATAGIKIAFDNLFDLSTWKAPRNIKPSIPESHRFETMVFASNMNIQSSRGIEHREIFPDEESENTMDEPENTADSSDTQNTTEDTTGDTTVDSTPEDTIDETPVNNEPPVEEEIPLNNDPTQDEPPANDNPNDVIPIGYPAFGN